MDAQLAFIAMIKEWDWTCAERELRSAAHNTPRAFAESTYTFSLSYDGRFSRGHERIAAARGLDPAGASTMLYLDGIRHWKRSPHQFDPRIMLNFSYIEAGQAGMALANIRPWEAKTQPSDS